MKKARQQNPLMVGLAWIGVAFSICLLVAAAWFHFTFDPLLRIPFVLFCGGGGLAVGLGCLGYIVTGKAS